MGSEVFEAVTGWGIMHKPVTDGEGTLVWEPRNGDASA